MKILTADIGGTSSRFALAHISDLQEVRLEAAVELNTRQRNVHSLNDLMHACEEYGGAALFEPGSHEAIALGVAGNVSGQKAVLPNIAWDIDLQTMETGLPVHMLNDFVAQAHAFLIQGCLEGLSVIRGGGPVNCGSIAVVGAGTGLGHGLLHAIPQWPYYSIVPSECGHVGFPFVGKKELEFGQFAKARLGIQSPTNDDVVSGSGIVLLNEFLTGKQEEPGRVMDRDTGNREAIELFTRFYARACRNYCLATGSFQTLIVSGGIAAKNPHLVESSVFAEEFQSCRDYEDILNGVSIYLNSDQLIGLKGAAAYSFVSINMEEQIK